MTWHTTPPASRGYGAAWKRLRKVVIQRDRGLCQLCKKAGLVRAGTDVDHIIRKADGGTDALENLRLLCRPCHDRVTNDANSTAMPFDARGFPTKSCHHWGGG